MWHKEFNSLYLLFCKKDLQTPEFDMNSKGSNLFSRSGGLDPDTFLFALSYYFFKIEMIARILVVEFPH